MKLEVLEGSIPFPLPAYSVPGNPVMSPQATKEKQEEDLAPRWLGTCASALQLAAVMLTVTMARSIREGCFQSTSGIGILLYYWDGLLLQRHRRHERHSTQRMGA